MGGSDSPSANLALAAAFCRGAARAVPPGDEAQALERQLAQKFAQGREAHPSFDFPPEAFAEWVGRRRGGALDEGLRAVDLYLACACALGVKAALATFEERCLRPLLPALGAALRASDTEVEEALQLLRMHFFVGRPGRPPSIHQYTGEGSLASWARVSALRELARARQRNARERPGDDELLARVASPKTDPELAHIRARYRSEFEDAFRQALGGLEPAERLMLRQQVLDNLSFESMGLLYGVNKSTISRNLARIRQALGQRTRERLLQRLAVSEPELESILRVVELDLDLSLRELRVLEPL